MYALVALLVVAVAGAIYAVTQAQSAGVNKKPEAFEELDFPQIEEGTPQAVTFGDCWTKDWMVLGVGNYSTQPIQTKSGK